MGQIVFMIPEKYEQIKASPEREIYEPENTCSAVYTAALTWAAE